MIDTDKEVEKDEPLLDTLFRRPITKNSSPACSSPSPLCPPPFRNENQTLDWGKNSFDWDNAIGSTGSGLLASTSFGTAEAPIDTGECFGVYWGITFASQISRSLTIVSPHNRISVNDRLQCWNCWFILPWWWACCADFGRDDRGGLCQAGN